MIKRNKGKLIVTSVVILLPIAVGLLLWNRLPDSFATHWGADGNADGWSAKAFAVFGMPLMLLGAHWLCVWATGLDPRNRDRNHKVFSLVLWIIPMISAFSGGIVYASALGVDISSNLMMCLPLGLVFLIFGNYMPKCQQNHTIGIKISWTLGNQENWNKTHVLAGKLWVAGGIVILLSALAPESLAVAVMLSATLVLTFVPMVYSWALYKKHQKEGIAYTFGADWMPRWLSWVMAGIVCVILIGCVVLMCTGDVALNYGTDSFTVEASYYADLTVDYDAIDSVEYLEECEAGDRTNGFGSPRLLMGQFRNDRFGSYTRYSYTGEDSCVVLSVEGKTLVLGGPDDQATRQIYEALIAAAE